jgi:subtilase family serine protease
MVALTGDRLGALNYALYHISYSGLVETLHGPEQGLPAWIPITSGNNPTHAHYGWNYVTGPGTYNAYAMVYDLQLYS